MKRKSLHTLKPLKSLTKLNNKFQKSKPKKSIFEQFGVNFSNISGNQLISNCPFCGSNGHFFINLESKNKVWDCKKCLRSGGFRGFVEQMVEFCFDESNQKIIDILSEERGFAISNETLMRHVGYHPWTQNYVIPYADKENIVSSLKIYDMRKMMNGSGLPIDLYGMWEYDHIKNSDKIFICEGEWDYLTLIDILETLRINIPVLAVPGAGSFNMSYTSLFEKKEVYLILDNDASGDAGTNKIIEYLWGIAKKIKRIKWDDKKEKGFDIRDLLAKEKLSYKDAYEYLKDHLIDAKKPDNIINSGIDSIDNQEDEAELQKQLIERFYPLKPTNYNEIFDVYHKHLYLPDDSILYITFGAMIAGRISGNPLWLFIVGPSGCGKSEILMSLSGAACVEAVSTLTPRALVSGWNATSSGGDSSLLPKLNNRMLIIKDFTTILSMNRIDQEEIISILRDAYDGEFSKQFGNGVLRRYRAKFGIVAATTAEIEMFSEQHSVMGERFIRWRMHIPENVKDRLPYLQKAASNAGKERIIRIELKEAANKILEADYSGCIPEVSEDLQEKLHYLAIITARLRTCIPRDTYTKHIINTSETELATRLNKQFLKLMLGIGALKQVKQCGDFEYNLIKQVALSSIQYRVLSIIKILKSNRQKSIDLAEINKKSMLSLPVIELILENLISLGIVVPIKQRGIVSNKGFLMNKMIRTEIIKSEIFSGK